MLFALAGTGSALAAGASVSVADFSYSPKTVTIHAGDTVSWSNHGPSAHTVTADGGGFDSGNLNSGQGFSHTFSTAGTYAYHCTYHVSQGMVGTVVVLPASGGGGGSGGGGTTPGPLPNTGVGSGTMVIAIAGIGLLLIGGSVLLSARRRRA
jgi:LPXTG-motif cell wall-anchored protein